MIRLLMMLLLDDLLEMCLNSINVEDEEGFFLDGYEFDDEFDDDDDDYEFEDSYEDDSEELCMSIRTFYSY